MFQDFKKGSLLGEKYCDFISTNQGYNPLSTCQLQYDTNHLDCSEVKDVGTLGCFLKYNNQTFERIILQFPNDETLTEVPDFGECESSRFFYDYDNKNAEFNKRRKSLSFFATKFDLSDLSLHTSDVTETVVVRADTVYMTKPLTVSYKLKVIARVVSLSKPFSMTFKTNEFDFEKMATKLEKHISFNNEALIMRHRNYGLVEVVDAVPPSRIKESFNGHCLPLQVNSHSVSIQDWYDFRSLNLMYVCTRTLVKKDHNLKLAMEIANYNLNLHSNSTDIGNRRIYLYARKFKRIPDLSKVKYSHNVPGYSLPLIQQLSNLMYERFKLYWINATNLENHIQDTRNRLKDMDTQFQIVDMEQERLLESETSTMKQIMDSSGNLATLVLNLGKVSNENIQDAIGKTGDLVTQMQEQDLKIMMKEAEATKRHYEDVVEKYETQVDRYFQLANASVDVQRELKNQVDINQGILRQEQQNFKSNVKAYKKKMMVKATLSIITGILNIASSFAGKPDISDKLEGIAKIIELCVELWEFVETVIGVMSMNLDFINSDIFDNINISDNHDFSEVLQNAVKLKKDMGKFDELRNLVDTTLARMDAQTEYEIDDFDQLSLAILNSVDSAKALATEVSTMY